MKKHTKKTLHSLTLSLAEYLKSIKNKKALARTLLPVFFLALAAPLFLSSPSQSPVQEIPMQQEEGGRMNINAYEKFLSFQDVPSNYPYRNAIAYAAHEGVIQGIKGGTAFLPSKPVSRIELIKMLMYSRFSNEERNLCIEPFLRRSYDHVIFPDIPTKSWMATSACIASKNGIVKGYSDGYLRPHLRVSFIEAAKIITKSFGIQTEKKAGEQWYVPAVRALGERGAIPQSIQKLDAPVTRGEIAEILYRLENNITNLPSKKYTYFPHIAPPPCTDCLVIDKIGVTVPIVYGVGYDSYERQDWRQLEKDILVGMREGVVHYPDTAFPGYIGNVFLTGHSSYYTSDPGKYKDVFAQLADLEKGDEYAIYYQGQKHVYKIFEEKIIKPNNTSVLNPPTEKELSTLMTCWPVWTNRNRKIFVAERVM